MLYVPSLAFIMFLKQNITYSYKRISKKAKGKVTVRRYFFLGVVDEPVVLFVYLR